MIPPRPPAPPFRVAILQVIEPDGRLIADLTPGLDDWVLTFRDSTAAASGTGMSLRPVYEDVPVPMVPSAHLVAPSRPRVAIGIPMTSRKLRLSSVESSPLMRVAVPSFLKSLPGELFSSTCWTDTHA